MAAQSSSSTTKSSPTRRPSQAPNSNPYHRAPSQKCHVALNGDPPIEAYQRRLQNRMIDTSRILSDYAKLIVEPKANPRERLYSSTERTIDGLKVRQEHERPILEALRQLYSSNGWLSRLRHQLFRGLALPDGRPPDNELKSLVLSHFPPRSELKFFIVDIFSDTAIVHEVEGTPLREWEKEACLSKPDGAIRWIHCPLGRGLPHSSIEDLFRHAREKGVHFEASHRPNWGYLEVDMLQFRSKQEIKDLHFLLEKYRKDPNMPLPDDSGNLTIEEMKAKYGDVLGYDLAWRQGVTGAPLDYWDLVKSDVPWLLNDQGLDYRDATGGDLDDITKHEVAGQAISDYALFRNALLVVEPLRFFHSGDGYLLTMSAQSGIDYVGNHFDKNVENPRDWRRADETTSAVQHLFKKFQGSGTSCWPAKTVEWLMIYILTEVAITPHDLWCGNETPSLVKAYYSVIRELGREKEKPWKPDKSKVFLNKYANVIDEISAIIQMTNKKIRFFKDLEPEVLNLEGRQPEKAKVQDRELDSLEPDQTSGDNTEPGNGKDAHAEEEHKELNGTEPDHVEPSVAQSNHTGQNHAEQHPVQPASADSRQPRDNHPRTGEPKNFHSTRKAIERAPAKLKRFVQGRSLTEISEPRETDPPNLSQLEAKHVMQERRQELNNHSERHVSWDASTVVAPDSSENEMLPLSSARIRWVLDLLAEQLETFEHLHQRAKRSHEAFSNVRLLEQNDVAIRTEQQDSSLLAINISAVIFLPLGLFASYFGMNFTDIRNTSYGSHTFFILALPLSVIYWLLLWLYLRMQKGKFKDKEETPKKTTQQEQPLLIVAQRCTGVLWLRRKLGKKGDNSARWQELTGVKWLRRRLYFSPDFIGNGRRPSTFDEN